MNIYGTEFYRLLDENEGHTFFELSEVNLGEKEYTVAEFKPVNSLLNNCYKIAKEKCLYTMDEGQDLQKRSYQKKLINQFKGIMAEMAIHIYCYECLGLKRNEVLRWDLERPDYKSAENEYDLKVTLSDCDLIIESRSSSSYKSRLNAFMKDYDIIGRYSNDKKQNEKVSDLYVRPVFQYSYFMDKEAYNEAVYRTFDDISKGLLKLYLVASVGKEEMYGELGYFKTMGQGSTLYRCIKIINAHDIEEMKRIIMKAKRS